MIQFSKKQISRFTNYERKWYDIISNIPVSFWVVEELQGGSYPTLENDFGKMVISTYLKQASLKLYAGEDVETVLSSQGKGEMLYMFTEELLFEINKARKEERQKHNKVQSEKIKKFLAMEERLRDSRQNPGGHW